METSKTRFKLIQDSGGVHYTSDREIYHDKPIGHRRPYNEVGWEKFTIGQHIRDQQGTFFGPAMDCNEPTLNRED